MIVLFTDYGLAGPYIGQVEARLFAQAPNAKVINLLADAPRNNPKAGAYLLAAYAPSFPPGTVFFCVVDPDVGSLTDKPVVMKADGRFYVGPDNGLFDIIARGADRLECWEIGWRPQELSISFHGRDLYAPVCAMLANGEDFECSKLNWRDRHGWPDALPEIIYVDSFGNSMTGLQAGALQRSATLRIANTDIHHAATFAHADEGRPFWYENANGLIEIAVNRGDAARCLGIGIGSDFSIVE